ncbi:hypothetical protein [Halobellus sp. H-GB7]|uniref:hypothetical protein n=1 Tax=Halobellus sp. H-GB7 TaxID=3069756 RepID=UPI0027B2A39A|nr:hypothetical protein [Halobellus sp. H-GB7]MDQ2053212.1 hypothetical protein [Halobellus sp. H-GB7]
MRIDDASRAAETMIDELDLASEDDDYELYHALLTDERFGAACYLYQEAAVYASGDDATEADREARDCLKRSIREHAQRVRAEVGDIDQEGADD